MATESNLEINDNKSLHKALLQNRSQIQIHENYFVSYNDRFENYFSD